MSASEGSEAALEEEEFEQEEEVERSGALGTGEVAEEESELKGGKYNAREVNDNIFEELVLPSKHANEVKNTWADYLKSAESREAAGEAIYAALFDAAPSLQSLFRTPRAVMAMRFMNGLNSIISQLDSPKALKIVVETLGFQHLDLEVTVPRVVIFRDAIVDLLAVELGARFTSTARDGWSTMLNYVGGSYIYVRLKYASRLRILASSWATANNKAADEIEGMEAKHHEEKKEGEGEEVGKTGEDQEAMQVQVKEDPKKAQKKKKKSGWFGSSKSSSNEEGAGSGKEGEGMEGNSMRNTSVPTTFNEMFQFNAAVMGFGNNTWMQEVLNSFDAIVTNASNSYRLQEECDVLALKLAKHKGAINLPEYKAVMLASLRSLVPKDWNSDHEVAWSWLWENVERMLTSLSGKPAVQEKALGKLYASLGEKELGYVRREVYAKFFTIAPAGQDYFKQSTTRLHFIADKVVAMTLDIYKDPKKMVEDISALGLRHVGYGIPTDLFGPFVTGCVQVIRSLSNDDVAEEAFRWALSLVSRILTRVITEGSTIVMKAINTNSGKQLKKAISCAPRGRRALWMLNIEVGTQSISPLLWAIETGSLDAAKAMVVDLLVIRADRDRYYFGMDTLFERHPDIIKRLCMDAPALMPTLLDGLIWRSRTSENGMRRVNYYIKHLMVDAAGKFSETIEWTTDNADPKLVCHPVLAMVTDFVFNRIAFRMFLYGKSWLVLTLIVFIIATAGLKDSDEREGMAASDAGRITVFCCLCFVYFLSLGQWLYFHMKHIIKDCRDKDFVRILHIPVPGYLMRWQDMTSMLLTILLTGMLVTEPVIRCLNHEDEGATGHKGLFMSACPEADGVRFSYSVFAMVAMVLYFLLLVDLSVFSTRVSAFVLICFRVLSEVGLFLFALLFFIVTFACSFSALDQQNKDFDGIFHSAYALLEITFGMFSGEHFAKLNDEPALLCGVFVYILVTVVFLLNLLIAQLNCSYAATYEDMLGFARLNRGKIVVEAMPSVASWRWEKFVESLRLDEPCEFGEGDVGVAGGVQVLEPASANITTVDMIRRFGGSTSQAAQWPQDDNAGDDEDDRFDRMEKLIEKAMKRIGASGGRKKGGGSTASGAGGSSAKSADGVETTSIGSEQGSE